MRVRTAFPLFAVLILSATAVAQDRISLRPVFKAGDESRYSISAAVETTVTPKGADGIAGTVRSELSATVTVRTLSLTEAGEANQEAVVEAISFSSAKPAAGSPQGAREVAGKKIEFTVGPSGYLSKCSIPDSIGYLTIADLLFSLPGFRTAGEVAVGGSWEAIGRGILNSDKLSKIPSDARTVFTLVSVAKGIASIEGKVTLNQNGSSVFDPGSGFVNVSVIAKGKGTTNVEVDVNTARLIGGSSESRVEGTVINIQPTAAGEKMQPREGLLVETSRASIRLIQ